MSRLIASIFAVVVLTSGSQAQEKLDGFTPEEQQGVYYGSGEGGDLTVELNHLQDDIFSIKIDTVVPTENDMPGCAGGIEGEMIMSPNGGNFFLENEDYVSGSESPMLGEQYCEIKLSFDDDGFLNLEEQSGCLAYHGAACEFTGQVLNERAVN